MPASRRDPRRTAGRANGSLLFLLFLLAGAGGWNYHRNLEIERQSEGHRPYESYSTEDIQALRAAFESELAGSQAAVRSGTVVCSSSGCTVVYSEALGLSGYLLRLGARRKQHVPCTQQ